MKKIIRPPARGWMAPLATPTGIFIRDFMKEKGEVYPFQVYRALRKVREDLEIMIGASSNVARYFWVLKRIGLIRPTGRIEPASSGPGTYMRKFYRKFYRIVPGREDDPRWQNPQRAYQVEILGYMKYKKKE